MNDLIILVSILTAPIVAIITYKAAMNATERRLKEEARLRHLTRLKQEVLEPLWHILDRQYLKNMPLHEVKGDTVKANFELDPLTPLSNWIDGKMSTIQVNKTLFDDLPIHFSIINENWRKTLDEGRRCQQIWTDTLTKLYAVIHEGTPGDSYMVEGSRLTLLDTFIKQRYDYENLRSRMKPDFWISDESFKIINQKMKKELDEADKALHAFKQKCHSLKTIIEGEMETQTLTGNCHYCPKTSQEKVKNMKIRETNLTTNNQKRSFAFLLLFLGFFVGVIFLLTAYFRLVWIGTENDVLLLGFMFLILIGVGILANLSIQNFCKSVNKPENIFFSLAILLTLAILSIGLITVWFDFLGPPLHAGDPNSGPAQAYTTILHCEQQQRMGGEHFDVPVEGNILICNYTLTSKGLAFDRSSTVGLTIEDNNKTIRNETLQVGYSPSNHLVKVRDLPIEIQDVGRHNVRMSLNTVHIDGNYVRVYSPAISFRVRSLAEYDSWKQSRLTFLLAVITLSFVTGFAAIKNLMDIWDRRKQ